MPITLPTSNPLPPLAPPSSQPPPPSSHPSSALLPTPSQISTHLRTHILRRPHLSSTREKGAAATVVLRGLANFAHFALAGLSRGAPWWAPLYYVLDQLVVMYAVGLVAEVRGGRRVVGGWRVDERFFDYFLGACGVVHVLYMGILLMCIVSMAIFFGVTGGFVLTIAGAAILPVAFLASRPEDGEGGLSLP